MVFFFVHWVCFHTSQPVQSAILGPELIIGRKKPERENYHLHTSRDRVERSMITKTRGRDLKR